MTPDTAVQALFLALLLILPLSSLIARRLPVRDVVKMIGAWIAIFALVMLVVAGRDRIADMWSRVARHVGGSDDQTIVGQDVRIRKSDDGHFWASASVDGVATRMLIDSGATTTAISADTARVANLDLDDSPFASVVSTANGSIAVQRSTLPSLQIGTISAHDLPVIVSPAFGDTDVLGMNFLSRLKGWRVEGDTLILQPHQG